MSEETKPEDLTTKETDETEAEGLVEFTTREDYMSCSYYALSAIADTDPWTEEGKKRKARIVRKCLRIIDEMVGEMYDELFNPDEDETE